jgi:hypothetical protein
MYLIEVVDPDDFHDGYIFLSLDKMKQRLNRLFISFGDDWPDIYDAIKDSSSFEDIKDLVESNNGSPLEGAIFTLHNLDEGEEFAMTR